MKDLEQNIKEAEKYYFQAEAEFKLRHYHLVVGHLMYALYLLEQYDNEKYELQIKIYLLLVSSHLAMNHISKAHEIWLKGYSLCDEDDIYNICEFYNSQGKLYVAEKNDLGAIKSYTKSLKLLRDDLLESALWTKITATYNMANCFMRLVDYPRAKKAYSEVLKFLKYYKDDILKGRVFMGLGALFHFQDEFSKAKKCYEMSLKFLSAESLIYRLALHNLAELELTYGHVERARDLYLKALEDEIVCKLDKQRAVSCLLGLAKTYMGCDPAQVHAYCIKALNIAMEGMVNRFAPREERDLGRIFFLLAQLLNIQGDEEKSKIYIAQAESIFNKYKMTSEFEELKEIKEKFLKGGE